MDSGKTDRRTRERIQKPDCVLNYNCKMGAVDVMDQMSGYYTFANHEVLEKIVFSQLEPHGDKYLCTVSEVHSQSHRPVQVLLLHCETPGYLLILSADSNSSSTQG